MAKGYSQLRGIELEVTLTIKGKTMREENIEFLKGWAACIIDDTITADELGMSLTSFLHDAEKVHVKSIEITELPKVQDDHRPDLAK